FLFRTMDCCTHPGDVGRLSGGSTDRMALSQPAGAPLAEPWQSRIFLVDGLWSLASRTIAVVPALPLVCRVEATPKGLLVELFINGGTMPYSNHTGRFQDGILANRRGIVFAHSSRAVYGGGRRCNGQNRVATTVSAAPDPTFA